MLACRLSDVQTEDRHIVVIEAADKKVLEPRALELVSDTERADSWPTS